MNKVKDVLLLIAVRTQLYAKKIKQAVSLLLLLLVSQQAMAIQVSDFFRNIKNEASEMVPIILIVIAGIGIITAAVAVISGVSAKRNRQPLEWQTWGMIGGALTTVIPIIILALSGSLTNQEGDADSVMSDLGL